MFTQKLAPLCAAAFYLLLRHQWETLAALLNSNSVLLLKNLGWNPNNKWFEYLPQPTQEVEPEYKRPAKLFSIPNSNTV